MANSECQKIVASKILECLCFSVLRFVASILKEQFCGLTIIVVCHRIEAFGEPKEVGEAIVKTITGSGKRPEVKGTLVESTLREDSMNVKYYELEFRVESPSFRRHNVAVCCARGGRLFTLNAQAPESVWPEVKLDFKRIAESFSLTS